MIQRTLYLLAAVAALATAPAMAQEPAATAPVTAPPATQAGGPRLEPGYTSYQPTLAQEERSLASAAAADRTVITISTLGLVLLVVLLILLLT
ncbi:MAG: hypothetical protein ACREMI_13800 [Gemmatimonadales bacterium]